MTNKIIREPVCFQCKFFLFFPFCEAYPNGIPEEIRLGKNDHKKPYPGDNGIQYEPIKPKKSTEDDNA